MIGDKTPPPGGEWLTPERAASMLEGAGGVARFGPSETSRDRLLRNMYAALVAEVPTEAAYARAARGWLTSVLAEMLPGIWEGLRTRPVRRAGPMRQADGPWGEPGHVLGRLMMSGDRPLPIRSPLYTERSWQRMLDGLANFPYRAGIQLWQLDDAGYPVGQAVAAATVERSQLTPRWMRLTFSAPTALTGWHDHAATQDQWAESVREQAGRIGACGGSMTDDIPPGIETALARATLSTDASDSKSRQLLQGYSWVTVVAAELAARLGGAEALAATRAFSQVSILPAGDVWLRATPVINDFVGEPVRKVFHALAPVLLTGTTRFAGSEWFRLVEGVDAADYQ